jgi:drug/metabolite transporter (DMT)-like permease
LFGELMTEARTLVRQEVDLAKTEMTQKATVAAKSGAKVAAGGVVALIGSLPLVAALVIGLGHLIGYGWAALIVGAVLTGIGAFMAMNGIKTMKATSLAPVQTKAQLQETKQWLQDQKR